MRPDFLVHRQYLLAVSSCGRRELSGILFIRALRPFMGESTLMT